MARKKKAATKKEASTSSYSESGDKTATERLHRWRFKVAKSRELRKSWETQFEVERCERYFLGKQRPVDDDQSLVFNYMLATIKVEQPNLFFTNPKFFVRPKGGHAAPIEDSDARLAEGILESIGDQDGNLENAIRLALGQSFFRIGVVKIIYDPKMEPNPEKGKPIFITDPAGNPVIDKARLKPMVGPDGQPVVDPQTNLPIPDPDSIIPMPMTGKDGSPLVEPDEVVTDEAYRYQWVNAKNMLLPDEGPDMRRWTWVGEEVVVPLEEAKEDPRFKKFRDVLAANETAHGQRITAYGYGAEKEAERLRYFECWNIAKKRICIFADGQKFDEFLYEDDFPEGIEEHPYAILNGYTPITAPEPLPWPLPHTYNWLDPQREYNIRRTQICEGAKRSARKGVYTEGTFDDVDEAIKVLQSSKDMEFAKINDPAHPPIMLDSPDLNPSIYHDIPLLQFDWRTITGQTGARLGSVEGGTATESSYQERASNIRDVDMRDLVEKWLANAGKKMLQRVKATLTLDMWIKLRGFSDEEFMRYVQQVYGISTQEIQFLPGLKDSFRERFGSVKWKQITRDDLDFESEVSVVPGSARPKNLETERRAFISLLEIFGKAPQLLLSRELASRVLRMFDMEDSRLLDELTAVAQKMIQVNANQAGRNQGDTATATGGAPQNPLEGLAGMLTGANVRQ